MHTRIQTLLLLVNLYACEAVVPAVAGQSAVAAADATVEPAPLDANAHGDAGPAVSCLGNPDADASSIPTDGAPAGTGPADGASPPLKDPAFDAPMDPNVDQLMQVPVSQIDLSKDFVLTADSVVPALQNFYVDGLQPGQVVPDFTAWTLEGKLVSLSDWRHKSNLLVVLGTPSCGAFRHQFAPQLAPLQAFADAITEKTGQKLQVLVVLAKEAHPALDLRPYVGMQWTGADNVADKVLVRQPTSFGARVLNGRAIVARLKLNPAQFLVDGMDAAGWQRFGALPNAAHLIDKDGVLVWKEPWAVQTGLSESDPTMQPELFNQVAKLLGEGQ